MGLSPEIFELAVRIQEGLLDQVSRVVRMTAEPLGEPEHAIDMVPVQSVKGRQMVLRGF